MAVGKLEYKKCTKCGRTMPATTEFFHMDRGKLHSHCKECKSKYGSEPARSYREIIQAIRQKDIDILKEKYPVGMGVEIRQGDKKLYGRITGHYEHFMTVQTSHYITSISYVDILIGAIKIK